jgi:hypothetical protein
MNGTDSGSTMQHPDEGTTIIVTIVRKLVSYMQHVKSYIHQRVGLARGWGSLQCPDSHEEAHVRCVELDELARG